MSTALKNTKNKLMNNEPNICEEMKRLCYLDIEGSDHSEEY